MNIAATLARVTGSRVDDRPRAVSGGSVSECLRYDSAAGAIFVKRGEPSCESMFAAEAAGLAALAEAGAVRVPQVLAVGSCAEGAFLALEWIDLRTMTQAGEALLGEQLARQHRSVRQQFGWDRDNTIGATPQPNSWCADWVTFLRERRLLWQLDLAARNGAAARTIDRGRLLCQLLDTFFSGYRPAPSLLHGDLWGGNRASDGQGRPVIFDPAVYYGDRETDIAMTQLFGGFGSAFYDAYQASWPLDPAAGARSTLYNLYHVLNHFNLFGGGYLARAHAMIDRLLAATGH